MAEEAEEAAAVKKTTMEAEAEAEVEVKVVEVVEEAAVTTKDDLERSWR